MSFKELLIQQIQKSIDAGHYMTKAAPKAKQEAKKETKAEAKTEAKQTSKQEAPVKQETLSTHHTGKSGKPDAAKMDLSPILGSRLSKVENDIEASLNARFKKKEQN